MPSPKQKPAHMMNAANRAGSSMNSSQDDRSSDVRAAIVNAAVDLFYTKGYQATSVREIVEAAGYTKGALYHYFTSKEEILLEIHDAFMSYGLERGREIAAGNHTPRQALSLIMRELLRQVSLYRPHMTIFLQETRFVDFQRYPDHKAKRDEWERIVVDIIERGIASGDFRPVRSTRLLSFGLTGTCVWAYHWFKDDGAMHVDEIADMFVDTMLNGLGT